MPTSFIDDLSIEVISDPTSPWISKVAALDVDLFGPHKSLSAEEFSDTIRLGGLLFAHISTSEEVVSESLVVFDPNPDGVTSLERALPPWMAYCDGSAVARDYRGRGLQKELFGAREDAARQAGKLAIGASVRQRNLPSIRSMFSRNYLMIADAPTYYGNQPTDARVFMLKDFLTPLGIFENTADQPSISEFTEVPTKIHEQQDTILITTTQSDDVDTALNMIVRQLLTSGYAGVSCADIQTGTHVDSRVCAISFLRLEALPEPVAQTYLQYQSSLQVILQ